MLSKTRVQQNWLLVTGWDSTAAGLCRSCFVRDDGITLELSWTDPPEEENDESGTASPAWLVRRPHRPDGPGKILDRLSGDLSPVRALELVDRSLPYTEWSNE